MKQKINLFLSLPQKPVTRCTLRCILLTSLVFFILLISFYGYQSMKTTDIKNEIKQVQLKQKNLDERIVKLKKLYSKHATAEDINKEISQLTLDIKGKKQLIEALSKEAMFNTAGYSQHLTTFAKLIPNDVWLTNINITKSGELITLNGFTYDIHKVLDFMHHLEKTPTFKNKAFKLASLSKYSKKQAVKAKKSTKKTKKTSSSQSIVIPTSAMTKNGKPLLAFTLQTQKGISP